MIFSDLISILEVISLTIPGLLAVAYVTIAERKTMASMQRRVGPNLVGYYGLLQAFADALKLLLKEYVSPTQSNFILFFLGPVITLVFSLLSFGVIPYMSGLTVLDLDLGILYLLAVSSLSTYGILLAGWSANSKYAFLGSLRSTAQLISYELLLSSAILLVILLTGSLNLTSNLEHQKAVWFIFPLFPVFIVFLISCIAETNRAPFDLAEAESELVSGFMTEHSAVVFVFFFLAEYASIVVICILTSILFLGGPIINAPITTLYNFICIIIDYFYNFIVPTIVIKLYSIIQYLVHLYKNLLEIYLMRTIDWELSNDDLMSNLELSKDRLMPNIMDNSQWISDDFMPNLSVFSNCFSDSTISSLIIGIKSSALIFIFIWTRASLPRIRFDQLMSFCWTVLLPIIVAFIILIPCLLYGFDILPNNINIL